MTIFEALKDSAYTLRTMSERASFAYMAPGHVLKAEATRLENIALSLSVEEGEKPYTIPVACCTDVQPR